MGPNEPSGGRGCSCKERGLSQWPGNDKRTKDKEERGNKRRWWRESGGEGGDGDGKRVELEGQDDRAAAEQVYLLNTPSQLRLLGKAWWSDDERSKNRQPTVWLQSAAEYLPRTEFSARSFPQQSVRCERDGRRCVMIWKWNTRWRHPCDW